ncbi:TetR/AcrR family transcriptional regulator [Clostridium felsineum]|uniref:HTH-type transcriptional regulator BetI n=1 Tax=Clostridium felsineum TaxID=36839 RepID=A0A1S8L2L0_9CLOT|nr:TetR/AcrR family transcriptional regulator [Clostridium felsineum]MCR3761668.1 TetR/AcrR family transcriptional regulator [Clostridium felsineum]URZ03294.1 HTH-type transcriptional regulator BetI [Clostridium felsineum]URZ08373.1 HTH-type transcriptional regulator BetI [Clostridium felsineum]URZ13404.1 HTH-type transcriptional regulator BetI [Clostridium felsineum]URZ14621.1 HTH-type transcriptional regulator BetI [Clostridium felsineum DSM 794]
MARKSPEDREREIMEAAIKIFSEKGYNAATTSEISKEAGIAEGTIFRYFKNKKALLARIIIFSSKLIGKNLITNRLEKLIKNNKDKNLKEVLKLIMLDRIDLLEKNKEIFKIVFTEIQYQEDLREQFMENIILTFKEMIEGYIINNDFNEKFKNLDIMIVGRTFIGSVVMYVMQKAIFPELIEVDKEKQVDQMVEMLLYGAIEK